MKHSTLFNNPAPLSNNDALLVTIFVAAIAHIVVILSVGFAPPMPARISRPIEVTLVNSPAKKAPKDAKFLAQEHQIGTGEQAKKPSPPSQKLPNVGNGQTPVLKKSAPEESQAKLAPKKVITQLKSEKTVVAIAPKPALETKPQVEKHPALNIEALQQQIRELGAEIRQRENGSDQTQIKFANAVSAHKYVAAQYTADVIERINHVGNQNFPKEALKDDFSVGLDIGVKRDGSLYSVKIRRSSGTAALDEAAKRIVRISAPFAPIPLDVVKELNADVIVISRDLKIIDEKAVKAGN
jgi:protein TonB